MAKAKRKKGSFSQENLDKCESYFEDIATCVPALLFDAFTDQLWTWVTAENDILDVKYYECIGCLLNPSLSRLKLNQPRSFQDSSLALESFLSRLNRAHKLRDIHISKSVVELIDFEFEDYLTAIGSLPHLHSVVLRGLKRIEVRSDAMLDFVQLLENNSGCQLVRLDLSESEVDDACAEVIGQFSELRSLFLNGCQRLETSGVVKILENLRKLTEFEANRGRESAVQNAVSAVESPLRLTEFVFRNPYRGMRKVAERCPDVKRVRIVNNVFEYSYDAKLDDCLKDLTAFSSFDQDLEVELDMSCFNMLFAIQMRNLADYGRSLVKLSLTESEFVHPQTLNPFALNCPRLRTLVIVNPAVVSDELFVGEVPELAVRPFASLTSLTFEGHRMSSPLSGFLLEHALELVHLHLSLFEYNSLTEGKSGPFVWVTSKYLGSCWSYRKTKVTLLCPSTIPLLLSHSFRSL